ncbi:CDP-glycerol glycerophosphotransferase family protein [Methanobacterium sp.]|uniref:CDP-glycerol glycerophosphotransferase family protein n=1 Tax=Methanobacterium sp. TaxID=2164 RepID=UPI003C706796
MKEYLKNQIKKVILGHAVTLTTTDDSLIFKLENTGYLGKKYLLIKHRRTGKRISKPVKNSRAELYDYELKNMGELGIFDIYLKIRLGKSEFVKRTKFRKENKNKYLINKKEKTIFRSYKTANSNLSFTLKEALFNHEITYLKSDINQVELKGVLNLFEDIVFDSVEIAAKSNDFDEIKKFKCEYEKKDNQIIFKAKINLEIMDQYLNTTWNLSIRLKNNEIILFQEALMCSNLKEYNAYEDYYLEVLDTQFILDNEPQNLDVATYYYSTPNNYLKLRITTKDKWLETLKKAQNRTIFEKSCQEGKIEDNLIFFESFHGQSYAHNPKYIYEKMLEKGYDKNYKFVWSYNGNLKIPGNPIIVNRDEESYYKYLAVSKFWINNISFPVKEKRKNAIYLQTTHGTPFKHMGNDIKNGSSQIVKGNITLEARKWDYLISANEYSKDIFTRACNFKKKVLNVGYPANDIFYSKDLDTKILQIKSNLGLNDDKKIILYAPTFRDIVRDSEGNHCFDLDIDLDFLHDKFNGEYIILLRLHYLISNSLNIDNNLKDFVLDVSNYDDIHELCLISDVLITDYSSVFFDFAHTKKPILFFMPDFGAYKSTRGLYLDIREDLPGPLLFDMNDLINGIENINEIQNKFQKSYANFYNKYCNLGHGDASEKVVNALIKGE